MENTEGMPLMNALSDNPNKLLPVQKQRLDELEKIIHTNFLAFYEVGCALKEIRTLKLYVATHDTFELYCREMWDMAKRNVYHLIAASKVIDVLSAAGGQNEKVNHGALLKDDEKVPQGARNITPTIPLNERQTRPLTRLETPEQQIEAWSKAVETAPNGRITAKHVGEVVSDIMSVEIKKKTMKIVEKVEPAVSGEFIDALWALIEVVRAEVAKPLKAKTRENMRDSIRRVENLLAD